MQNQKNESVEKLVEMVKDIRTCMLITNPEKAGSLTGRPMAVNTIDADGSMWFFTKKSSNKIEEISDNDEVSLAVINDDKGVYLMINGNATLSDDKAKMEELWNPFVKAWFPDGLEDPEILLIKVLPKTANYWDSSSNVMVEIYHTLKAIVTGTVSNEGEYGEIKL